MNAGPVIVTVAPLAVALKRPVGSPLTAAARPCATSVAWRPRSRPGSLVMPCEICGEVEALGDVVVDGP